MFDRTKRAPTLLLRSERRLWAPTLLIFLLFVANSNAQTIEISGKTMGPIDFKVEIGMPVDTDQQIIADGVSQQLAQVNELMSTYRDDSELSQFNQHQETDWFPVSKLTAEVVQRALEISEQTDGAFDVTVGPLVKLWNFGPDKGRPELPSDEAISAAKSLVGYQHLSVRLDPPALKKDLAELQVDLSAIAKGFAVDRVAERLAEFGIENYLINVGGEVRANGEKPNGQLWRPGIELPDPDQFGKHDGIAKLDSQSMATSGDYRNFFVVDGKSYSHTIDPQTGRPVEHELCSASILSDDCMTADAYATAALVMGLEDAKAFFDAKQIDYHMIERVSDGFQKTTSDGFPLVSQRGKAKSSPFLPMFVGAALIFGLAVLGMAVGAIVNNKPIKGSCGGLSAKPGEDGEDASCSLCHKPVAECPDIPAEEATS